MNNKELLDPEDQYLLRNYGNFAELGRLAFQDNLFTAVEGGILAERTDTSRFRRILDMGCGSGGWGSETARVLPKATIIGIDNNQEILDVAKRTAQAKGLHNIRYQFMNMLQPLNFPNNSFDLVNARLVYTSVVDWHTFLRECVRVTKPGGVIRLTEMEWPLTNSPAFEFLSKHLLRALDKVGRIHTPGQRSKGITTMLRPFLRHAGCVKVESRGIVVDFSTGTRVHQDWYQDFLVGWKAVVPFLLKAQVIDADELEREYQQALKEMSESDFGGMFYLMTVWGEKPTSTYN